MSDGFGVSAAGGVIRLAVEISDIVDDFAVIKKAAWFNASLAFDVILYDYTKIQSDVTIEALDESEDRGNRIQAISAYI